MEVVQLRVDANTVIYVEVAEGPTLGEAEGELQGVKEKMESIVGSFDQTSATIVAVCRSLHEKAYTAMAGMKPASFEVEFAVKLGGELGVPLIAKGEAEAQFKIKATWGGGA